MSKPMYRSYELRGTPPKQYLHQIGRLAPGEIESFGYSTTTEQPCGIDLNGCHDLAVLWRNKRGDEIWVGEPYPGCETCGLPQEEHASGERRFAASISIRGETPEITNARLACETFK